MSKSYQWAERGVITMLNAFKTNASVAQAEALITSTTTLLPAEINDSAYAPADVRKAIIDEEFFLITLLCRSVGHPARSVFEIRTPIAHREKLPASLSPDRIFEVDVDGVIMVSRERLSPSQIDDLRCAPESVKTTNPYHAISGNVYYSTYDAAEMIHYGVDDGWERVAHASTVDQKFDNATDLMLLPDEFIIPLIYLATAQMVDTGDSDSTQSGSLRQAALATLAASGIAPTNAN